MAAESLSPQAADYKIFFPPTANGEQTPREVLSFPTYPEARAWCDSYFARNMAPDKFMLVHRGVTTEYRRDMAAIRG